MSPDFLEYGYLGFLAILIISLLKIIDSCNKYHRSFKQVLYISLAFSSFSILSGIVGYVWASKQLELATKNETIITILDSRIQKEDQAYLEAMRPLQTALENASDKLSFYSLGEARNQYISEMEKLNNIIKEREKTHSDRVSNLKKIYQIENDKKRN